MDHKTVDFISDPSLFSKKENLYLEVRRKEGRVLDDDFVVNLPDVSLSSPYAKEWRWRKRSFLRLLQYLQAQQHGALRILDLGCGNGWMSNRLAENPKWDVTAVDLNKEELEQGARLFGREKLRFLYADILGKERHNLEAVGKFQVIILAASVQYFLNMEELIACLSRLLSDNGEIHCIDSHFYPDKTAAAAAKQRTLDYYTSIGVPEMAANYHHHLWPDIQRLGGKNLNSGTWTKLKQKAGYLANFPWIRLRKP